MRPLPPPTCLPLNPGEGPEGITLVPGLPPSLALWTAPFPPLGHAMCAGEHTHQVEGNQRQGAPDASQEERTEMQAG